RVGLQSSGQHEGGLLAMGFPGAGAAGSSRAGGTGSGAAWAAGPAGAAGDGRGKGLRHRPRERNLNRHHFHPVLDALLHEGGVIPVVSFLPPKSKGVLTRVATVASVPHAEGERVTVLFRTNWAEEWDGSAAIAGDASLGGV